MVVELIFFYMCIKINPSNSSISCAKFNNLYPETRSEGLIYIHIKNFNLAAIFLNKVYILSR